MFSSPENISCTSGQNASAAAHSGRGNIRGVQKRREMSEGECPGRGEMSDTQPDDGLTRDAAGRSIESSVHET